MQDSGFRHGFLPCAGLMWARPVPCRSASRPLRRHMAELRQHEARERRVQNAWDESQARRERDAIYIYLTAVFDLVAWWTAENRAVERARKALRLRNIWVSNHIEPFA